MSDAYALRPLLTSYPDARRGRTPLFEPILLPYVALVLGSLIAGLLGAYNAALLRRPGLLFRSLLFGFMGWITFIFVAGFVAKNTGNPTLGLVAGRLLHFALGGELFAIQRPHVKGHAFLGGAMVPLLGSYFATIFVSVLLPWSVIRLLLGDWLGR